MFYSRLSAMARSLLVLAYFLPATYAYTTFDTNCTLPSGPERINYVSSPNTRGTLDILWSCLFTIISCTWTVQYPDLPIQRNVFEAGRIGWCKWAARKYYSQAKWFLLTIIAPEVLLGQYIAENAYMMNNVKDFQDSGYVKLDRVDWTRSHICLVEMGALVIKMYKRVPDFSGRLSQAEATATENAEINTHELSPGAVKGQSDGVVSHPSDFTGEANISQDEDEASYQRLDCPTILALRRQGILTRMPDISTEEIQDRSKADGFVRVITVFQILWLCVQIIARAVGRLAVTQLEIGTVAFAICAVFMYILCWDKPKGVQTPITFLHYYGDARIIKKALAESKPNDSTTQIRQRAPMTPALAATVIAVVLGGMIFGGVHLIAWNFAFPTYIELVLWRVSALFCTCGPPLGYCLTNLIVTYETKIINGRRTVGRAHKTSFEVIQGLLLLFSLGVYALARLFIIVEMFRTLAFQPTDAYVGTWTVNIPYVS